MTKQTNYQGLLDDIINDARTAEPFYQDSLNETLRLVRRRRRTRRSLKAVVLVTCVSISTLWISKHLPAGSVSHVRTATGNASVVETARTGERDRTQFVATQTFVNVYTSAPEDITAFVTTRSFNPNVRILDDATLLAFAAPHPVALLRISPGVQTLIFMEDTHRLDGSH